MRPDIPDLALQNRASSSKQLVRLGLQRGSYPEGAVRPIIWPLPAHCFERQNHSFRHTVGKVRDVDSTMPSEEFRLRLEAG